MRPGLNLSNFVLYTGNHECNTAPARIEKSIAAHSPSKYRVDTTGVQRAPPYRVMCSRHRDFQGAAKASGLRLRSNCLRFSARINGSSLCGSGSENLNSTERISRSTLRSWARNRLNEPGCRALIIDQYGS